MASLEAMGVNVAGLMFAPPLAGLAGFCVFAALLGWLDDAKGLPASAKLLALIGAAIGAALLGTAPAGLYVGGAAIALPGILGVLVAAIVIFVMANAVNFMDGANGIAMGTALIILAVIVLMLAPSAALMPERQDLRC